MRDNNENNNLYNNQLGQGDDKASIYNKLIAVERLLASKGRTGSKHVNLISDEGMREFIKESNELRDKEGIKPLSDEKPLISTGGYEVIDTEGDNLVVRDNDNEVIGVFSMGTPTTTEEVKNLLSMPREEMAGKIGVSVDRVGDIVNHYIEQNIVSLNSLSNEAIDFHRDDEGYKEYTENSHIAYDHTEEVDYSKFNKGYYGINWDMRTNPNPQVRRNYHEYELRDQLERQGIDPYTEESGKLVDNAMKDWVDDYKEHKEEIHDYISEKIDDYQESNNIRSHVSTLPKMSTKEMEKKVGVSEEEMKAIKDKYVKRNILTVPEIVEVEEEFEDMFKPRRNPFSSRQVIVPEQEDYKCPTCGSTNITKTFDRVLRIPVLTCNDCVRELQPNSNYKEDMNGDVLYSDNLEVGYKSTEDLEDSVRVAGSFLEKPELSDVLGKGLNSFSGLQDKPTTTTYGKSDVELTRQLYIRNAIRERLEAFAGEVYFDIFEPQSSWKQICTVNEESLIEMIISCMSERDKTYDVIKQFVSRFHDREIYSLVDSVLDTLSLIDNNINQLNRIKPVRALEELTVTPDITPELKEHYEAAKFEKATTPKTMSMREEQLKDTSLEEFLNKIYIKVMEKIDNNSDILKEVLKSDLTQSYKLPVFHSRKEILSENKDSVKERLNSFIDLTSSRKIGTLPISINKVKDKIKIATRKKDILRLPITSILVMVEREIILIRDSKSIKITGLVQDALQLLEENNDGLIAVLGNKLYDRTRVHLYNEGYKPRAINLGEYLDALGTFGELNLLTGSIGDISITDIVSLYEGQEKLYIEF